MSALPAVVFDLGKVLVNFDYGRAVERFLKRCPSTAADLHRAIDQSPLLLQYEAGGLSSAEFFARVKAATGFVGDFDEFKGLFGDIFTPIPPMVQLHADLKQRGLPTYIFSNTNELAMQWVRGHFPFFNGFDGYVFSYEQKAMKPNPHMYEAVEKCSGRRGPTLFYLDDRPENIAGALRRGWQAWLHETPDQSRAWLAKAGLLG